MNRITGNYYFFVPDEPVYMEWFDEYLAVLYLMPDEARYIFTEDELLDVGRRASHLFQCKKRLLRSFQCPSHWFQCFSYVFDFVFPFSFSRRTSRGRGDISCILFSAPHLFAQVTESTTLPFPEDLSAASDGWLSRALILASM